ncbi:MAG: hypothetical protein QOI07_925 [Verrucomicrobiota bacterium]|jgi:hypothetical protein
MPVRVDTSNFNGFCRQIAAQPLGLKVWDVMLYEVGKVLEGCVRLTTREKVDKITRSVEFKNRTLRSGTKGSGPATIYITKKGIAWFADEPGAGYEGVAQGRKAGGKTFHPMTEFFHYGRPRWDRYQQFLAQLKNQQIVVRDVIGRGAQSWVQIGNSLGIKVAAPDYVRNAKPFRGVAHINGVSRRAMSGDKLFLEMKNFAPILLGTMDGNRILQTSINGRYKYFLNSARKINFDDVAAVARQYPGLLARAA